MQKVGHTVLGQFILRKWKKQTRLSRNSCLLAFLIGFISCIWKYALKLSELVKFTWIEQTKVVETERNVRKLSRSLHVRGYQSMLPCICRDYFLDPQLFSASSRPPASDPAKPSSVVRQHPATPAPLDHARPSPARQYHFQTWICEEREREREIEIWNLKTSIS